MSRIDLLNFCEQGDLRYVQSLLEFNQYEPSHLGQAIIRSIEAKVFTDDHLKIIRILIERGASLTVKDNKGISILMLACSKLNIGLISLILTQDIDVNIRDKTGRNCISVVFLFSKEDDPVSIVKLLCEQGVAVNDKDIAGASLLHYAAAKGFTQSIEYLISKGADPNIPDTSHDLPLHIAFRKDKIEAVQVLFKRTDLTHKNQLGKLPINEAFGKGLAWLNSLSQENEKKNERNMSECFECKLVTEVFCLGCAKKLMGLDSKTGEIGDIYIKLLENEEKLKGLEAENSKLKKELKDLESKNKLFPLDLPDYRLLDKEQLVNKLEKDIKDFQDIQETFAENIKHTYNEVINLIRDSVKRTDSECSVDVFGSFATGLFLPHSDIDLVIFRNKYKPSSQVLEGVAEGLGDLKIVMDVERIFKASVPVLKLNLFVSECSIKIDLTVHEVKHKGKDCVKLVSFFMNKFPEIKGVYLVIKQLAFCCGFNQPFNSGVSSYSLFLMLVSYYQTNIRFKNSLGKNPARILIGFLEYYSKFFTFEKYVLVDYEGWDNRDFRGKQINRSLNIPDPLNPTNNVAYNTELDTLLYIFTLARYYISKPLICSCESSFSIVTKVLYESLVSKNMSSNNFLFLLQEN